MGFRIDLKGKRFGKLLVIEESQKKYGNNEILWKCLCECGNIVHVSGNLIRQKIRKSCGCIWKPHDDDYLKELKSKLEKNSKWNGQCQEWTGRKNRKGYGRVHITDKTLHDVHKISWLIHVSRIPKDYVVRHNCGNLGCFRPDHLYLEKKDKKYKGIENA